MPVRIVPESHNHNGGLLDAVFRLRHTVFGERCQWDVQSLHGREIDSFDTPEAIYGVSVGQHGILNGTYRLLPTTGPYMLRDIFPELLHGQPAPEDPRILESSRFAVLPPAEFASTRSGIFYVSADLLASQLRTCLELDVHTVVSVTDVRFEKVLRQCGLGCERYGDPIRIGKSLAVAGWMHPTEKELRRVEARRDELAEAAMVLPTSVAA